MPIGSGGGSGSASLTWTAVTGGVGFTNGWTDLAGYGPVGYALSGALVYLRGSADPAAAAADGVFTLPLALRPAVKRLFPAFMVPGGSVGAFEVLTTGVVSAFQRGSATSFFFDGVVFSL